MTARLNNLLMFCPSALLAACGPPLGAYQIEDLTAVDASKPGEVDENDSYDGPEPHLIRIKFTSSTDLETASEGGDLYVHGDYCPFKDRYRLGLIGPFYNDQSRTLSRRVTSYEKLADGRERMSVESINRKPTLDHRSKRYIYTAYLIPSAPKDQFSEAYDLRRDTRDICLRIDHPGYYLTPSRSNIFRIKGSQLRQVLGSARPNG